MAAYELTTIAVIAIGIFVLVFVFLKDLKRHIVVKDQEVLDKEMFNQQVSIINEKILELHEYHHFVTTEIENKHKELLFLYQIIAEKEKQLMSLERITTTKVLDKQDKHDKIEKQETDEKTAVENKNQKILEMTHNGESVQTIAKALGIGIGEVNLVLNLYK